MARVKVLMQVSALLADIDVFSEGQEPENENGEETERCEHGPVLCHGFFWAPRFCRFGRPDGEILDGDLCLREEILQRREGPTDPKDPVFRPSRKRENENVTLA